jgi:hypothetical protein
MRASTFICAAALSLVLTHARAQEDQPPPYDNGPVWTFTEIATKDGHFDDYMKWLDTDFKSMSEGMKAKGVLLDYKIFVVEQPRHGEGDIWIAREYPNMATFDRTPAETASMLASVRGSNVVANQKQAARGSIRELLSQVLVREIKLK